jgi:hypothetical protein
VGGVFFTTRLPENQMGNIVDVLESQGAAQEEAATLALGLHEMLKVNTSPEDVAHQFDELTDALVRALLITP